MSTPKTRIETRRVKVEGGFTPTWQSDVLKTQRITSAVNYVGKEFLKLSERQAAAAAIKYNPAIKLDYFYGSKTLKGEWGATFVMWPTNKISKFKDNKKIVFDLKKHFNLKDGK